MTKIAVIGCGVIGAAIAYELSRIQGLEITLIDRQVPASGSTKAALGVLMGAISHKIKGRGWRLRQESIQRYETLIPELETLTGIHVPFNRQGIVMLCFPGEDLEGWQKLSQIRRSQGWNLEIWDKSHLQERCPQIENEQIIGAIYSPQDRQVDPTILTQALVAGAQKNGVKCEFGKDIEKIASTITDDPDFHRCAGIYSGSTIWDTDWLVLAAGLGTTPLSASLNRPVDIRPVLGQALHLKLDRPLGNSDFQPVITGNDVHIVPLDGGEYWVGATVEFPKDESEIVPEAALLEQLTESAIAFIPALKDATIIRTWSGKRPRPEGQPAPLIGKLTGYTNVLLASGHYRNGILLAPATALEIANFVNMRKFG